MNDVVAAFGIESWKPLFTALALPPVPFLVLVLLGARLILSRRGLGWSVVLIGVLCTWVTATNGFAEFYLHAVVSPPPALTEARITSIGAAVKAHQPIAIVVVGGGRESLAPEYGTANLTLASMERMRYGMWLNKLTGAPTGFTGGLGWSTRDGGATEAEVAERIASQEYGRPLRWVESQSRDTRQNATHMIAMLRPAGIKQVVLVTSGYHMPRVLKRFEEASRATGAGIEFIAAPVGLARRSDAPWLDWIPSNGGFTKTRNAVRETMAAVVG